MKRKNIENMLVLEDVYQEKIKTLNKMHIMSPNWRD